MVVYRFCKSKERVQISLSPNKMIIKIANRCKGYAYKAHDFKEKVQILYSQEIIIDSLVYLVKT